MTENPSILTDQDTQNVQTLDVIRNETALSRYPLHRLSNKGIISINIRKQDEKGATSLLWEVTYNSKYGQPGPLAYRLDTRIVNRKIDEAGRPVSKILKLGSLREIAEELGLGGSTNAVRTALRQNASAYITAKITYKAIDKTERTLEADFTRYSIVFTGEKLPDGRKADAVYLILNDIYAQILDTAMRRPLDYEYLRELAPGPQRFYEILSYEMLPAIRFNQRAKLPYSEFCLYSTMTRYETYEQMKKQMWKIHHPHIEAGYIAKVAFEATMDEDGKPDWNMFYVPGERARFQQLAFSFDLPYIPRKRTKPEKTIVQEENSPSASQAPLPFPTTPAQDIEKANALARVFYRLRYEQAQEPTPKEIAQAKEILLKGEEWANFLVEAAARQGKKKNGFPENFGGVERLAPKFQNDFDAEQKHRDAARDEKARQSHEKAHRSAYIAFLGELVESKLEEALPEAYRAFNAEEERTFRFHKVREGKSSRSADIVATFYETENRVRRLLEFINRNPKSGIPTFWQWDAQFNPATFHES